VTDVANLSRTLLAAAGAAAILASPGVAGAAAGVILKHKLSVYADEAGKALKRPEGVACSDDGRIVVADSGNGRLLEFTFKGEAVMGGRPAVVSEASAPAQLQLDAGGEAFVLDGKSRAVVRLDAKLQPLGAVELKGVAAGTPAPAIAAFTLAPGAIALLDGAGKRVLLTDRAGTVTRTLPLPAGKGTFTDVAVDAAGTVFVIDAVQGALWSADKGAPEFRLLNGNLKEAASFPSQLTVDGAGNLFVVDRNGGGLLQLGTDGTFRARHREFGWADGQLQYPVQVCVASDFLVVADRGNHRIQVFTVVR
jgi:sugar lactone lactonase YvrE